MKKYYLSTWEHPNNISFNKLHNIIGTGSVRFPGMRRRNLPSSRKGLWKGEEGNSFFELRDDYPVKYNDIVTTGAYIKEKYGIKGIDYINSEPDFSQMVDEYIGEVYVSEGIPIRRKGSRNSSPGTYDLAETIVSERLGISVQQVRQYMKDHELCWHECGDMHTIIPIPRIINAIFSHTAGIGNALDKVAISTILTKRINGRKILKADNMSSFIVETNVIDEFINAFSVEFVSVRAKIKDEISIGDDMLGISTYNQENVRQSLDIDEDFEPINFYNKRFNPLKTTRQTNERTFLNGEWVSVFDHPFSPENQNIICNQGTGWPNGPRQTCGNCACGTIMNKTGICSTERDVVAYAWSNELCSDEGFTTPDGWCKILSGAADIPAYNSTGEPLETLAKAVESGRGVIIGVRASVYRPEMYPYIPGKADGHALVLTSVIRSERTGEITEYVVIDSNGENPKDAIHRVRKKILEKAYTKQGMQSVVTKDVIW